MTPSIDESRAGFADLVGSKRVAALLIWSCPRCHERGIWDSWAALKETCPTCGLELRGDASLAAVWVNTWLTILPLMAWIVGGLVVTAGRSSWWLWVGAVVISSGAPPLGYRVATGLVQHLLFRLDPPIKDWS